MRDTRGWIELACDGDLKGNLLREIFTIADAIESYAVFEDVQTMKGGDDR
jgi:hypothetical protein